MMFQKLVAPITMIAAMVIVCGISDAHAQVNTRTNSLSLINANGDKITLSYEGIGDATFTFPQGSSTTVGTGTLNGQTLAWNSGAWQPMSNLLNTGTGISIPSGNLTVENNIIVTTGSFNGSGAGLTFLNADNIESGTLDNARLSPDIPRLSAATNIFTGRIVADTVSANYMQVFTDLWAQVIRGTGANIVALNAGNIETGLLSLERIDTTGATAGQVLTYDGSALVYSDGPGGFSIPYADTSAHVGTMFSLVNTNSGTGSVANFENDNPFNTGTVLTVNTEGPGTAISISNSGTGMVISSLGTGISVSSMGEGIYATGVSGNGITSTTQHGIGISASSATNVGGRFESTDQDGVRGMSAKAIGGHFASGLGIGVVGAAIQHYGGHFTSTDSAAIYARSTHGPGGRFESVNGQAVVGYSTNLTGGYFESLGNVGVHGRSGIGVGVEGSTDSGLAMIASSGLYGTGLFVMGGRGGGIISNSSRGIGVKATTADSVAGYFLSTKNISLQAVNDSMTAVDARSTRGRGIRAQSTQHIGGHFTSTDSTAVVGISTNDAAAYFESTNAYGLAVRARYDAIDAISTNGYGGVFFSDSVGGLRGISLKGIGGMLESNTGTGLIAISQGLYAGRFYGLSRSIGVMSTSADSIAGYFESTNNTGVHAITSGANHFAGQFEGAAGNANGIQINAGVGGIGLQVDRGRLIGSYISIASGDDIPEDVMVVHIQDSGDNNPAEANLPGNAVNGQILMIACPDLDGFTINGITHAGDTMRQWVFAGGAWFSQD